MTDIVIQPRDDEAVVNVTWRGQCGDLPSPAPWNSSDRDIIAMATEAIRHGGVRGIDADPHVDLDGFMVQKVDAKDGLPNRFIARPKTPFGV